MSDEHAVPEGFVLASLGSGFGERFGPVYVDRPGHRMGFRVGPNHLNPIGGLHGGACATFADTLLLALRDGSESGNAHHPTISLSVDYLAPAVSGAWVEADVILVKATRTMLFVQSVLTVDGEPIARVNIIYRNRQATGASS